MLSFQEGDICKYTSGAFVLEVEVLKIYANKLTAKIGVRKLLHNKTGSRLFEEAFKDLVKDQMVLTASTSKIKSL
jgi:HD superfamily phosphohydrolase YqeK